MLPHAAMAEGWVRPLDEKSEQRPRKEAKKTDKTVYDWFRAPRGGYQSIPDEDERRLIKSSSRTSTMPAKRKRLSGSLKFASSRTRERASKTWSDIKAGLRDHGYAGRN